MGLGGITLSGALAVVHADDDGGRGLEVLGDVDVHAQLGGAGVEVVDLGDGLCGGRARDGGDAREGGEDMHSGG